MASVHMMTQALSVISSRVNAHHLLLEDLKKTVRKDDETAAVHPAPAATPAAAAPDVDYGEISRLVDLKLVELKDELGHKSNRDKAILETGIQHSVTQKVASAVAEVDQRNTIGLLLERVKDIETKLDDLTTSLCSARLGSANPVSSRCTPRGDSADSTAESPLGAAPCENSGGTNLRNEDIRETLQPKEVGKTEARPRTSRRRPKTAEKDESCTGKEPTTLTLDP